jgi:hypothetical protein
LCLFRQASPILPSENRPIVHGAPFRMVKQRALNLLLRTTAAVMI